MVSGRIGAEYVVGRDQMGIAETFGRLRVVAQHSRSGTDIGHWQ
jgi:hypothetical protein